MVDSTLYVSKDKNKVALARGGKMSKSKKKSGLGLVLYDSTALNVLCCIFAGGFR